MQGYLLSLLRDEGSDPFLSLCCLQMFQPSIKLYLLMRQTRLQACALPVVLTPLDLNPPLGAGPDPLRRCPPHSACVHHAGLMRF